MSKPTEELEVRLFANAQEWTDWLSANHETSDGLWLQLGKKGSSIPAVTYPEALEIALCYGWIDGQRKAYNADVFLHRFTPRRAKSIWSKINRDKVIALIESGKMQPAGLREVEKAKQDGRWDAAYAGASSAEVPEDLQAALDKNPAAKAFFATLKSTNRYAILFRIHHVKKAETRARKIEQYVAMLEKGETIYS